MEVTESQKDSNLVNFRLHLSYFLEAQLTISLMNRNGPHRSLVKNYTSLWCIICSSLKSRENIVDKGVCVSRWMCSENSVVPNPMKRLEMFDRARLATLINLEIKYAYLDHHEGNTLLYAWLGYMSRQAGLRQPSIVFYINDCCLMMCRDFIS